MNRKDFYIIKVHRLVTDEIGDMGDYMEEAKVVVKIDKDFNTDILKVLSDVQLKNVNLVNQIREFNKKIDFYMNLSIDSEYERGFYRAFEIMKSLLNGGDVNGR